MHAVDARGASVTILTMPEFRPPYTPLVSPGQIELFERDMTVTMAADLSLGAVQEKLGAVGQWLPVDGDANAAIGELVAQNSTGPLRLGYGAWRDLLLGCQFRNGAGELITAGGRTVKNVAGYDLTKFVVGQRGSIATIVALTTRTYRRPAGAVLATFAPSISLVQELIPSALRPQWMLLTGDALLCGYLADERSLGYYASSLASAHPRSVARRTIEEDVAHRGMLWSALSGAAMGFRAALPPARIQEFVARARLTEWIADPAFGIVVGRAADPRALQMTAEELGGNAFSLDADGIRAGGSTNVLQDQVVARLRDAFNSMTA